MLGKSRLLLLRPSCMGERERSRGLIEGTFYIAEQHDEEQWASAAFPKLFGDQSYFWFANANG